MPIIGTGENFHVQQFVADVLGREGVAACARGYSHQPVPEGCRVVVEHDSSIRDETRYAGIRWAKLECKTAPMTLDDLSQTLPKVCGVLTYLGARVNTSTGLHVHHHLPEIVQRPQVARSLMHFFWRFAPVLYTVVAPSRRGNQYCRAPQQADARRYDRIRTYEQLCRELGRVDRYCGLNLTNLNHQQRMTVEWRMHHGTLDANKILSWALATQRWTEHAVGRSCHFTEQQVANDRAGINALLVTTGLKPNSRIYREVEKDLRQVGRYLLKRWKKFNVPEAKAKPLAA